MKSLAEFELMWQTTKIIHERTSLRPKSITLLGTHLVAALFVIEMGLFLWHYKKNHPTYE